MRRTERAFAGLLSARRSASVSLARGVEGGGGGAVLGKLADRFSAVSEVAASDALERRIGRQLNRRCGGLFRALVPTKAKAVAEVRIDVAGMASVHADAFF